MIFNYPVAGAGKTSLPVFGVPLEEVTVTGKGFEQKVILNENGIGKIDGIKFGECTVIGATSKEAVPGGRKITINNKTKSISAYPDGAVYWFGNGVKSGDSLYEICGGISGKDGAYPTGYGYDNTVLGKHLCDSERLGKRWYTSANNRGSSTVVGITSQVNKKLNTSGKTKLVILANAKFGVDAPNVFGLTAFPVVESTQQGVGKPFDLIVGAKMPQMKDDEKRRLEVSVNSASGYFVSSAFGSHYINKFGTWYHYWAENSIYAIWLE